MKKLFLTLFTLLSLISYTQQSEVHVHDRHCRHYPEQTDTPKFAWRSDWQSQLVHNYDVNFYFLDIEVSNMNINVSGVVEIQGKVVAPLLDTFAFELIQSMNVTAFTFNGVSYTQFTREGDNVLVPVASLPQGESFIARITYGGTPPTGGFFAGVTNAYSSVFQKNVTWTLSEPFSAKSWFPCKQDLPDKADSVWVFLTTPIGTKAGSQGLLTNVTTLPSGKPRYEWKSNYPTAYYLISFAVADYQEYNVYAKPAELQGDSILVQNFVYNHPNFLPQYQNSINAVVPMIELFSDIYKLYPFYEEKYGHCISQLGGGMEHQTMTTLGSLGFNLVAHELGHMWFGDNVTCATWSDIWINEGFATYSNYLAQEMINGWNAGQSFMIGTQNNVTSQNGGSVYVPPTEVTQENVWRIFNGRLSYDKGAAIIHTLRHEINNDDLFFQVMNTFQNQFADSTATGDDFRMVAEAVTGMDFEQFFDQWYYGEGFPRYAIEWYMEGQNVHLNVTQTTSSSTPLFKMTLDYKLTFIDGTSTVVRLYQDANLNQFNVPVDKEVVAVAVDPDNWTFEKVNSILVTVPQTENSAYFTYGPNPVNDKLNVYLLNSNNSNYKLFLTDLSGKVVLHQSFSEMQYQLDLSDLASGSYLLKITDGSNSFTRKIVR
ncbi:MAG: peptidase M1 membrane alanine aminopeptidase [Bacteroidetes bacterium]|nr:MAG: peptidase M1 membrane alanine aminopeptidase [Bacteroidota bacterium]